MSSRIAHAGQLSESFKVKTGVQQGCLLSPFLFLLVIDWIIHTTTTGRNNSKQWTLWTQLDDLSFSDDLARCSCHIITDAGQYHSPWDHISRDRAQGQQEEDWVDEDKQLPTHQSQLVNSPSWRWSLSSTWEVRLTNTEVRTQTSQPESARQEQLLSCSKTSGHLEKSAWEPNSASSTPMWSQSCSTDVRHGGLHRWCNKRFRHSSTLVWGASTKSDGRRRSEMKICGSKQDRNQWPSRYCGGSGAGLDTPSGSQHPAPHAKPWPGTRRGRGREASLVTAGGETLKHRWNNKGPTGLGWPKQPRTECDGEGS